MPGTLNCCSAFPSRPNIRKPRRVTPSYFVNAPETTILSLSSRQAKLANPPSIFPILKISSRVPSSFNITTLCAGIPLNSENSPVIRIFFLFLLYRILVILPFAPVPMFLINFTIFFTDCPSKLLNVPTMTIPSLSTIQASKICPITPSASLR